MFIIMIHLFNNSDGLQVFFNLLISKMFRGLDLTELVKIKIHYFQRVFIHLNFMEIIQDLSMDSLILYKMSQESLKCL